MEWLWQYSQVVRARLCKSLIVGSNPSTALNLKHIKVKTALLSGFFVMLLGKNMTVKLIAHTLIQRDRKYLLIKRTAIKEGN